MSLPDSDTPSPTDQAAFDRVSHGYAPDGRPITPPPVPLDKIVRDVVDTLSSTAKAEFTLLQARGALVSHGIKWASAWGFVAACALLVAMLAVAFGAILVLSAQIGPLLATLTVFVFLILLAGFAGWRAKLSGGDVKAAFRDDLLTKEED